MYRQHFGLKYAPFGKDYLELWQTKSAMCIVKTFFQYFFNKLSAISKYG